VIGRFSVSGGLPEQVDKPATVRGLALAFLLPNGQQWRTAMVNTLGRLGDALAARYPVTRYGHVHLPGIAPHDITLYAVLRQSHSFLALLLFVTFTAHMCAVLFHTLVLRDGLLDRMSLWRNQKPSDNVVHHPDPARRSPTPPDAFSTVLDGTTATVLW
jgi:hypothetical protein